MKKLKKEHKDIILNIFEEFKDIMMQNGLYDSELEKAIEEITPILEED